jgi:hypothetical protein
MHAQPERHRSLDGRARVAAGVARLHVDSGRGRRSIASALNPDVSCHRSNPEQRYEVVQFGGRLRGAGTEVAESSFPLVRGHARRQPSSLRLLADSACGLRRSSGVVLAFCPDRR